MGDAIYNFQACCIIITNKHHNRHVCNSNEGTKVSFMLKETIYGKSPIFSPVIKSIPFFWPKYRLRYAYCHMIVIYILAQWNHKIIYTMKKCNELWSHVKTRVIIYNCRIDPFIFFVYDGWTCLLHYSVITKKIGWWLERSKKIFSHPLISFRGFKLIDFILFFCKI